MVIEEPESPALRAFLEKAHEWSSSEMLAAELARGVRRRAADAGSSEAALVLTAEHLVEGLNLLRLDSHVIAAAGRLDPVTLRTLDAIHVVTAIRAMPLAAFVSYDRRQLQAAELVGLPTMSPGA